MRLLPLAATASCVALALPAFAASPFDTTFAMPAGGKPCYARAYDRAHLKAHPRQTVSAMEVDFTPANADGVKNVAAKFELGFAFQIKGKTEWYGNTAYCHAAGGFACSLRIETAAGRPNAAGRRPQARRGQPPAAPRRRRTRSTPRAAPTSFGGFGKPGGDDLSFLLQPRTGGGCAASHRGFPAGY